ncbi:MAG: GIY-YIG nuclease family protein [Flavipsychrobacter sp.]|nr:GIY-YIG nuclease family protein [Flavipsychrobacter sp.]
MSLRRKGGTVYILATPGRKVLYTGVTSDIVTRLWKHQNKVHPNSFTAKYGCCVLVYYRNFENIADAIAEEKRVKAGSRKAKEQLIESINYNWQDLSCHFA